uniref:Putative secreted protein n=1 Tax=Amblyomma parvum TaxID=251391 RepID=A0A023G0C0_AMBPA
MCEYGVCMCVCCWILSCFSSSCRAATSKKYVTPVGTLHHLVLAIDTMTTGNCSSLCKGSLYTYLSRFMASGVPFSTKMRCLRPIMPLKAFNRADSLY